GAGRAPGGYLQDHGLPHRSGLSRSGLPRHGEVAEGRVPRFDRPDRPRPGPPGMGDGDRCLGGHSRGAQQEAQQRAGATQGTAYAQGAAMTFSLIGRCGRTGMFGVAITTSSICVASRCPWARAGAGAVATQNVTDPSIGPRALDLMAQGRSAPQALAEVIAANKYPDYRQVTVIDRNGQTA